MHRVESIIRDYHQSISQALEKQKFSILSSLEEHCLSALENQNALTTEIMREIDDLPSRIMLSWLRDEHGNLSESELIAIAKQYFKDDERWLEKLRHFRGLSKAVLLQVMTWQCEMRCTYCSIPKQSGRETTRAVLDLSAELLFSAPQDNIEMRYFGGEPLLEWEKIQYSVESMMNFQQHSDRCRNKKLSFLITSNGAKLTEEKMRWISQYPISLQLALDGLPEAQNRYRPLYNLEGNSYDYTAIDKAELLQHYNIPHSIVLVIHPARVEHMLDDFRHIVEKGFEVIQINWAHNNIWHTHQIEKFAKGLYQLSNFLHDRWAQGRGPKLLNLREILRKVRAPREITVDWDGKIYANNIFLFRPHTQKSMFLGELQDGKNWLHYKLNYFSGLELDSQSLAEKVFDNNAQVGTVFNSWIRWMVKQGIPEVDSFISTTYRA